MYLNGADSKLLAVADANRKMPRHRRSAKSQIEGIGRALDPWRGSSDPAVASAIDKDGGRFRVVLNFGIEHRALQTQSRRLVENEMVLDHRQHGFRNGGRNRAAERVRDNIDAGYRWFAEFDISEFYRSFNQRRLNEIVNLPEQVIQNVVCPPEHIRHGHIGNAIGPINLITVAREGISQGSSLSALVAELLVASILSDLRCNASIINYADNFGVMARTKQELMEAISALTRAFQRCPLGPFQLISKDGPRRVCEGFDFLGYRFRTKRGRLLCLPSDKCQKKFFTRSLRLMTRMVERREAGADGKLQRGALSWASAFPLWHDDDLFWTGFWLRGVARQHYPRALPAVERLTEYDDGRFVHLARGLPAINPPTRVRRSCVDHW